MSITANINYNHYTFPTNVIKIYKNFNQQLSYCMSWVACDVFLHLVFRIMYLLYTRRPTHYDTSNIFIIYKLIFI